MKSVSILRACGQVRRPLAYPRQPEKAKRNLRRSRAGRGQPDMEQRHRLPAAHKQANGDSYAERAENALNHYETRGSKPIIEADKAEQETGQEAVNRVGPKILRARPDNLRVLCERAA